MPPRGLIAVASLLVGLIVARGAAQSRPAPEPASKPTSRPASAPASQPADDSAGLSLVDNFHEISAGRAYRSGQLSEANLRSVLTNRGIRTVINLRGANPGEDWYRGEVRACADSGVKMIDVRMSAGKLPPREELLKLFDAFASAPEPLLMHCESGADRSGAAAAIWRMQVLGETLETARGELALRYGHLKWKYPRMTDLIEKFRPDRHWIETEYSPD